MTIHPPAGLPPPAADSDHSIPSAPTPEGPVQAQGRKPPHTSVKRPHARAPSVRVPSGGGMYSLKAEIQREAVHVVGQVISRGISAGVVTAEKQVITKKLADHAKAAAAAAAGTPPTPTSPAPADPAKVSTPQGSGH